MSAVDLTSLNEISQLIEQFNEYENVFELSFLHYNGKNEIITLQYRLRTYKSFMDGEEFLKNFLEQYLKHTIQIHSNLYSVQINDQNSTRNLHATILSQRGGGGDFSVIDFNNSTTTTSNNNNNATSTATSAINYMLLRS